jgi:hypothetical protein
MSTHIHSSHCLLFHLSLPISLTDETLALEATTTCEDPRSASTAPRRTSQPRPS